jgi:hypothetical protein
MRVRPCAEDCARASCVCNGLAAWQVVAAHPSRQTQRMLCMHARVPRAARAVQVDLDTALLSERDSVHVHSDLVDACIYICAPEVLVLFSDNFDFQHIQRDFIRGVLSEEELGNKLHIHLLHTEYAAHIANLRSYAAVSMDILSRRAPPNAWIACIALGCGHARTLRERGRNAHAPACVQVAVSPLSRCQCVAGTASSWQRRHRRGRHARLFLLTRLQVRCMHACCAAVRGG